MSPNNNNVSSETYILYIFMNNDGIYCYAKSGTKDACVITMTRCEKLNMCRPSLSLEALTYFCLNHGDQWGVFNLKSSQMSLSALSDSYEYL